MISVYWCFKKFDQENSPGLRQGVLSTQQAAREAELPSEKTDEWNWGVKLMIQDS